MGSNFKDSFVSTGYKLRNITELRSLKCFVNVIISALSFSIAFVCLVSSVPDPFSRGIIRGEKRDRKNRLRDTCK